MYDELPVINTARLTLRIAGPEDAAQCVQFQRENAAFLAPWEPEITPNALDVAAVAKLRELAVADALAGTRFAFALYPSDPQAETPIVGFLDLTNVIRGVFQACYMGYKLDRRMEGYGYMSEAARAAIGYAFNTLRLHRIMANYMPHNQRSAALLRRLGFTIEGVARDYLYIAGGWRDHVMTSLTNPEPMAPGTASSTT